jgi:hypothetical protein
MSTKKSAKRPEKKRLRTKKEINVGRDETVANQGVCTKAPEWAEHHRLWDDDQPCDDGRSGRLDD